MPAIESTTAQLGRKYHRVRQTNVCRNYRRCDSNRVCVEKCSSVFSVTSPPDRSLSRDLRTKLRPAPCQTKRAYNVHPPTPIRLSERLCDVDVDINMSQTL
jgi:hypothetical protein